MHGDLQRALGYRPSEASDDGSSTQGGRLVGGPKLQSPPERGAFLSMPTNPFYCLRSTWEQEPGYCWKLQPKAKPDGSGQGNKAQTAHQEGLLGAAFGAEVPRQLAEGRGRPKFKQARTGWGCPTPKSNQGRKMMRSNLISNCAELCRNYAETMR